MPKFKLKDTGWVLSTTLSNFIENNPFRLAAALAYNAIFSLPPLLLIIIALAGIFMGQSAIEGKLYGQLEKVLGHNTALAVQDMVRSATLTSDSPTWAIVFGVFMLLLAATTFFITLQDSLNTIWDIRPRPGLGIMEIIRNRFLSFGLLLSLVFLMLISFMIQAALGIFDSYLEQVLPSLGAAFLKAGGICLAVFIIVLVFMLIYKFLPDAHIRWRDIWVGALVTTLLFIVGKYLIGWYISANNIANSYGAAGSLLVLLVWIYYSSLLIFFGAELTQTIAYRYGHKIVPRSYAQKVALKKVNLTETERLKEGRPPAEGRWRKN